MLKILILTAIFVFILLSSLSFAAITYSTCEINNCILTIGECSSGILNIYSTPICSGLPSYKYTFYGSSYVWRPATTGPYYLRALCDNGVNKTDCTPVTVRSAAATTTTTPKERCPFECCEDEPKYLDKPCGVDEECIDRTCESTIEKKDYTWIIVAAVVVIIIIFVLIFFVFRPKPRRSFEELYRKWSK